ncbi:MAG: aminotransferase class V-fold PLP-dependent enzyme [Myxococcales bacterium]|nr:aspartate aminotransferase family protein [Myxococcales bacterium]HIK84187.1 aspartate aminotransferase family protein [Myxococcales bacterium]
MTEKTRKPAGGLYPYADRLGVIASFPEKGRPRDEILRELNDVAKEEDSFWQTGQCSGTMYCGDTDHYAFLNEVYSNYSHVNALQRDICPSATRFEGEITAMALDLMHASAARGEDSNERPCGSVTSGGTESIITSVLMYRDQARKEKGITQPELILPTTAHPAFEKGAHLFGLKVVHIEVNPETTLVEVDAVRAAINKNTAMIVGSAGNYPYGTIDPIEGLSALALEHGIGLHVDGCLGGFILPWGERLGYDIPVFDFRLPGVTSISADTHKYGFGLKGTSVLLCRTRSLRHFQYFATPEWPGGKYNSPGIAGSRSGGLMAAAWASMVSLGQEGYLKYAKAIFETAFAMQDIVRLHPELKMMGNPTFCFSFTSNEFDIYHVNDFMKEREWRFNGQQFPNAIHMCVTRPQTQPGVVERFGKDLAEAVTYAKNPTNETPKSAAIYGGYPKEDPAANEMIMGILFKYLDQCQDLPPGYE